MRLLLNWVFSAIAIAITAYLLPGVSVEGPAAALLVALVLGIMNALVRPLLLLLTLPVNILTLGLFTFVINAMLVLVTSSIVPGFSVATFWWALVFGIVLALVQWGINLFSHPA